MQQVVPQQQQEELQTVTHKKVVVRTIQTRDGQVCLSFSQMCPALHSLSPRVEFRIRVIRNIESEQ